MRDSHRAEAEGLLRRAVEEEVRRSGGRTDGNVLLSRARAALDAMAGTAGEEYSAYTHALDEAAAGQLTFRQRYAREGAARPCWWPPWRRSPRRWPTWRWAPAPAPRWARA